MITALWFPPFSKVHEKISHMLKLAGPNELTPESATPAPAIVWLRRTYTLTWESAIVALGIHHCVFTFMESRRKSNEP